MKIFLRLTMGMTVLLLTGCCPLPTGCPVSGPQDLEFARMEALKKHPTTEAWEKIDSKLINVSEFYKYDQLRIIFRSKINFAEYKVGHNYSTLWIETFLCGRKNKNEDNSIGLSYFSGGEEDRISGYDEKDGFFYYQLKINPHRLRKIAGVTESDPPYAVYNLTAQPETVCAVVKSQRSMFADYFQTNILRIPKETVAEAFRENR